ncbi:MAG: 3'(2'),5'-bisphosphate nucleotidase CysQ [Gammaproteobacteria bacterium]|nr:3'(2'),5'-bisphosphate nucleotidase CysQ [Gammaproteobacteria bacterium]
MADRPDKRDCDPCILLTPALEIAITAGKRILEIYEGGFEVQSKADDTPLTEADMAAHRIIEAGLRELTPELPVLTEESINIPFVQRQDWNRYWLVDPLDGTREFIERSGEFSINIALIDNHEAVMGIIYAPVLGVYYYACRGQGAYKREATNEPRRLQTRPWDGQCLTVVCSRATQRGGHLDALLEKFACHHEILTLGGALKSCLVAEGKADLYPRLGPTSEWDTAAAQCILEEAGGAITDTNMQPLRYNTRDKLLNPHFLAFGDKGQNWSRYL